MGWLAKLFQTPAKVMPVHVDDANFRSEVLQSELPVMLDVWSPGCQPCQQLEPIVMRLAARYQGRVKVAEINAAASPRTMRQLEVDATPTVLFFHRGRVVERSEGFHGEAWHDEIIRTDLLGEAAP